MDERLAVVSPFVALGPQWFLTLVCLLLALGICDLLYRRVGNVLTLMPLVVGLLAHGLAVGPRAALAVFGLSLLVFVVGFGLYALGLVGAADVKMAAALTSCAGLERTAMFLIYTCIVAGGLGLVVGLERRPRSSNLLASVLRLFDRMALVRARQQGRTVPLAVALGTGLLWSLR